MNARSHGTALIMALGVLLLVGIALAAAVNVTRTDATRTVTAITGAQARQLLLAGQASAMEELQRSGGLKSRPLALPPGIGDATATLMVDRATADRVEARIAVVVARLRVEQSLLYTRQNDRWTLSSAVLP